MKTCFQCEKAENRVIQPQTYENMFSVQKHEMKTEQFGNKNAKTLFL